MNDKELIEWIKSVKPGEQVPSDTGPRVLRLIQIILNRLDEEPKRKPGRPKLSLNKDNAA